MTDHLKLISTVFGFVAPIIGILIWIIKTGMNSMISALKENTKALSGLVTTLEIHTVQEEANLQMDRKWKQELEDSVESLVDLHTDRSKLCPFTDVEVDMLKRASKEILSA